MDFIKKNVMLVVSAAVSVLALVLLVFGIFRMDTVKEMLSPGEQLMNTVNSILTGVAVTDPKDNSTRNLIPTERVIENLKDLQRAFKQQGHSMLQECLQRNIGYDPIKKTLRRQPILEGIFPTPITQSLPYRFPELYRKAINQLFVTMQAGTVPTEKDLVEGRRVNEQKMGLASKSKGGKSAAGGGGPIITLDPAEVEANAIATVADNQARTIKVYYDSVRNLDVLGEIYSPTSGRPPSVEDLWWAQLSYWIQDDIAHAIAQANASAKNVYESAVKRILKIQIMHGYLLSSADGRLDFVGADELQGPASFTGMGSEKNFDVLRFEVNLIVDARKIPQFIDAMYRQSHYLMYLWTLEGSDPATPVGNSLYRYGQGVPVVTLKTYWEAYQMRDFYHWGIIGYGLDNATKKSYVLLYDGKKKDLDDTDLEKRAGLPGLMPKKIRQILGSEPADPAPGSPNPGG